MADDWRLMGQEKYLMRVTVYRRRWKAPSAEWDHDHCTFCWAKFMEAPDALREGYTTAEGEHWICLRCFKDFRDRFGWTVGTE